MLKLLNTELEPLVVDAINIASIFVELPRPKLTEQQLDQARTIIEKTPVPEELPWLHSVDLTVRNNIVLSLFTQKQLEFAEENKSSKVVEVGSFGVGELLILGLPFEPFAEIGMETFPGVCRRFVPEAANMLVDAAEELATSLTPS